MLTRHTAKQSRNSLPATIEHLKKYKTRNCSMKVSGKSSRLPGCLLWLFLATTQEAATDALVRPFPSRWRGSSSILQQSNLREPSDSKFGRRDYWNDLYKSQDAFSWYTTWNDLEPFWRDLCPSQAAHILIPGVGNDPMIRDMYDAGYYNLTAFDYAPAGVECAKQLLQETRIRQSHDEEGVTLLVADARNMMAFEDHTFDLVLDKGTLDAIYLSGGHDKVLAEQQLAMAVDELHRVLRQVGIVMSITATCVDAIQQAFSNQRHWKQIRDGTLYFTDDGYASNNVDGTLLAWKRVS